MDMLTRLEQHADRREFSQRRRLRWSLTDARHEQPLHRLATANPQGMTPLDK
jgi:hypothetical protein